jgi:hypothetical protein
MNVREPDGIQIEPDLIRAVKIACNRRQKATRYIDTRSERTPGQCGELLGWCFHNAYVLYEVLRDMEYGPTIVAGVHKHYIDREDYNTIASTETLTEIGDRHILHFWIEVLSNDHHLYVECASENELFHGDPAIFEQLPDGYQEYSDGTVYGERERARAIAESLICRQCGDKIECGVCGPSPDEHPSGEECGPQDYICLGCNDRTAKKREEPTPHKNHTLSNWGN